jgi:hypothetical protein
MTALRRSGGAAYHSYVSTFVDLFPGINFAMDAVPGRTANIPYYSTPYTAAN